LPFTSDANILIARFFRAAEANNLLIKNGAEIGAQVG
jgi:hypothetical protein